ncbi:hypothetical protein SY88_15860 [Clostridiales bacterium PH28_bin88]|nr:hypothetical protein SY88_15860 [Clostridiales bacterium PH28_bin88]
MAIDLLIKNGQVVIPQVGVQQADTGVADGKIVGLYTPGAGPEAKASIDATGLHIFPGTVDPHWHLGIYNDSMAADFEAETRAAAIGGITTIVNCYRGKESYLESAPVLIETGENHSLVDFTYTMGLLTQQHLAELKSYIEQFGITSYKFYRNYQDDIGRIFGVSDPLTLDSADMFLILKQFAAISDKLLLCIHCEDMDLQRRIAKDLKAGGSENTLSYFSKTSPDFAETVSLMSALYLNDVVKGNMYAVHISAGSSIDLLEKLPHLASRGVTIETCTHYLALTEDSPCGLLAKVNPPIHTAADAEKLWEGIRKGLVQAIGSDNCPSNRAKKYGKGEGVWETLPGFPGAGMILPILISEGYHRRGIPLGTIAHVTSAGVAKAFNLFPQKGAIQVGADADFAIVDLNWEREVKPELFGANDYSVYDGMKFKGWPVYTVSRGEIIMEKGQVVGSPGRGRYLRRSI